jgi:hypothetical protein
LAQGIPGHTWEHDLGTLPEVYDNITCDFCTLVKQTLQAWYGEQHLESWMHKDVPVKIFLFGAPFDIKGAAAEQEPVPCYLEIGFPTRLNGVEYREDRFTNDEFNRAAHLTALFSIASTISTEAITHIGRVVKSDIIDLNIIDLNHVKSWITSCYEQAHQKAHHEPLLDLAKRVPANYPSMRVVDAYTACVAHFPDSAPYVALGYQWGMDQKLKMKGDNKGETFSEHPKRYSAHPKRSDESKPPPRTFRDIHSN